MFGSAVHAFRSVSQRLSTITARRNYCGVYMSRHDQEEQLFKYTSGRWIYNETLQCATRHVEFDLHAAQEMACRAVDANQCIKFVKLIEGSYNKLFLLHFDNNMEAMLRFPCPLAGPSHLMTASEVATMQFLREELGVPVPRVLAWSSTVDSLLNPVGAEYILMEKIPGVEAHDRWDKIMGPEALSLLRGLLALEGKFGQVYFSQLGSLYFKEDVSAELQARPLLTDDPLNSHISQNARERYRIGPLTDRMWWRGERATMKLDRGPWPDMKSYMLASAHNEQRWLETYAHAHLDFRKPHQTADPAIYTRALQVYADAIPHFMPSAELAQPTLWHPDLSLANIIVAESGEANVNALIDWQGAWAGPFCMQATLPPAIAYEGDVIEVPEGRLPPPPLPEDIDEMPAAEQERLRVHHRKATRHKWYELHMFKDDIRRRDICALPHAYALNMLSYQALRIWSDGYVPLMNYLLQLRDIWEEVAPSGSSCPIDFSDADLEYYAQLREKLNMYDTLISEMNRDIGIGGDGWVPYDGYAHARDFLDRVKLHWDDGNPGIPFPFEEKAWSFFLS